MQRRILEETKMLANIDNDMVAMVARLNEMKGEIAWPTEDIGEIFGANWRSTADRLKSRGLLEVETNRTKTRLTLKTPRGERVKKDRKRKKSSRKEMREMPKKRLEKGATRCNEVQRMQREHQKTPKKR